MQFFFFKKSSNRGINRHIVNMIFLELKIKCYHSRKSLNLTAMGMCLYSLVLLDYITLQTIFIVTNLSQFLLLNLVLNWIEINELINQSILFFIIHCLDAWLRLTVAVTNIVIFKGLLIDLFFHQFYV